MLDLNYGGSTGYGREFRERLIGEWGIVDENDCANAALFLVGRGEADRGRIAIGRGSAGGFIALAAMTFRDVFKVGASYFGVSDLEALLGGIHKFDAHSLVGPYPLYRRRYIERSPINFSELATCPATCFQGLEDTIVRAIQSEEMFNTRRGTGSQRRTWPSRESTTAFAGRTPSGSAWPGSSISTPGFLDTSPPPISSEFRSRI